jgi:hypothetical protein
MQPSIDVALTITLACYVLLIYASVKESRETNAGKIDRALTWTIVSGVSLVPPIAYDAWAYAMTGESHWLSGLNLVIGLAVIVRYYFMLRKMK